MKRVTEAVGWFLSTAATLTPAASTTVANERAMRFTQRAFDVLAANMEDFEVGELKIWHNKLFRSCPALSESVRALPFLDFPITISVQ